MKENKKKLSQAMLFIILFGIVSLFSDMTHEGRVQHPRRVPVAFGRVGGDDRLRVGSR